jgi:hypothetical protein
LLGLAKPDKLNLLKNSRLRCHVWSEKFKKEDEGFKDSEHPRLRPHGFPKPWRFSRFLATNVPTNYLQARSLFTPPQLSL